MSKLLPRVRAWRRPEDHLWHHHHQGCSPFSEFPSFPGCQDGICLHGKPILSHQAPGKRSHEACGPPFVRPTAVCGRSSGVQEHGRGVVSMPLLPFLWACVHNRSRMNRCSVSLLRNCPSELEQLCISCSDQAELAIPRSWGSEPFSGR